MFKLMTALLAVAAAGIGGAMLTQRAAAQETEEERVDVYAFPPRSGYYGLFGAQTLGTWQIMDIAGRTLLLNTASGATFYLTGHEDELKWKAIPRPPTQGLAARARILPVPMPEPAAPAEEEQAE